jgi:AraC-like DNA-binding protein
MKPILFRNLIAENESFHVQEDRLRHFYDFFHYHPELQITLILKSSGSVIVGDKVCSFTEGDLFLFGPDLPHVFRDSHQQNTAIADPMGMHAIFVYFKSNSFGEHFFQLPENHLIKEMLQKSSRGIRFSGIIKEEVKEKLVSLTKKKGTELLIAFFEILHVMSQHKESEFLSSISFMEKVEDAENTRIEQVMRHVMKNFNREISLEEVAKISAMSVTSFCRFFKQRTRKTFTEFVNEVRVGHACKELLYSHSNINEVAYRCGFNNISNFNRQFKAITGLTPSEYTKNIGQLD